VSPVGNYVRRSIAGFVQRHGAGFFVGFALGGFAYWLLSAVVE